MPKNNLTLIKKLKYAINQKGDTILLDIDEFYNEKRQKISKMYKIKRQVGTGLKNPVLYQSTYDLYIIYFLRDMLYELEGKELPDDNEEWNEIRKKIKNGK